MSTCRIFRLSMLLAEHLCIHAKLKVFSVGFVERKMFRCRFLKMNHFFERSPPLRPKIAFGLCT